MNIYHNQTLTCLTTTTSRLIHPTYDAPSTCCDKMGNNNDKTTAIAIAPDCHDDRTGQGKETRAELETQMRLEP